MTKQRSALSWVLSIGLHGILAAIVIGTSYKIAFPEGAVETVTFEVATQNAAPQIAEAPQAPTAPEPENNIPKQTSVPTVVKKIPPQKTEPTTQKPKFIPDQPQNNIAAANEEESQVDAPPQQPVENSEQNTNESSEEAQETSEPQTIPALKQNEPITEDIKTGAQENQSSQSDAESQAPSQAPEVGPPRPAFGAPGSIIDETKLTEKAGNRKPQYPWSARLKRQEGTVVLKAFVKSDGSVDSISLYQSSGFQTLDKEAIEAYSKWRYTAGAQGWVLKPFKFSLVSSQ